MNLFLKSAQNKFRQYALKPLLRFALASKVFKNIAHLFLVLTLTSTVLILSPSQVSAVVPSTPNVVSVSKTATSATFTVTPGVDGGSPINDYTIQYSTDGTTWTTFNDGVSTLTSITVTDLTRGTPYQFRIAQTTAEGTSDWSTPLTNIIPAVRTCGNRRCR